MPGNKKSQSPEVARVDFGPDGRPCILLYVPLNGFCEFIATLINPLEASSISILILDEFSLKVMPLCPGVNEEHAEDGGPEL